MVLLSGPRGDVVARQGALHQPLHPQSQAVQFVMDLQGGQAAGSFGSARRVVVAGAGPGPPRDAAPFVLGGLAVGVFPGVDGPEQTEVLLVAVECQHKTGVVHLVSPPVVLVHLHGVLGVLQQRVHPLAVFVNIQEGEMQRQAPGWKRRNVRKR
ncbi:hypothetical protein EYF80_041190 [Liparis tanakae]|uniref:Uncharacterized protein n=1 Tax=Liparis tanakae TaxID=230148 RepID=A0A4Z2G6R9_9TELE|nr:hypothetical protein EYF80_041190 [Liparis tanakae]